VLVCFPLRTVAFRGHGFSLLEKPTLRGLQTRAIPAGQGRLRQLLHRTKKNGLYFRGVNGPPLQTTIIIVKASYTVLLPNIILAKEIPEDSLKKKTRYFCVRCISKKPSLSCGKAKTMRPHSERGHYLSKLLCSLAPRKHAAKRC